MISVTLIRHGEAAQSADPEGVDDASLPLTVRGKHRTERAARGLVSIGLAPELILSSPLKRARQTARILAKALSVPSRRTRESDALLPDASTRALWKEFTGLGVEDVMFVGHAASLNRFFAEALGGLPAGTAAFKRAGAARLWIKPPPTQSGKLIWYLPPRILRRLGGV